MIRLFILGFIAIIGLIATIVSVMVVFSLVKWAKRWTTTLLSTSKVFADQQHQHWKTRQTEKNIPAFLRDASKRMAHIDLLVDQMPSKWKHLTDPLVKEAHEMLQIGLAKSEQAQLTRSYYTTTLKAVEGLVEVLVDMKAAHQDRDVMQSAEERKAKETIEILMNDTYKYRAKLESKKRFDFHVMMEVITQRFGK